MSLEAPFELLKGCGCEGPIRPPRSTPVQQVFNLIKHLFALVCDLLGSLLSIKCMNRVGLLQCMPNLFEHQGEQGYSLGNTVYFKACCGDLATDRIEYEG